MFHWSQHFIYGVVGRNILWRSVQVGQVTQLLGNSQVNDWFRIDYVSTEPNQT